MLSWRQLDLIDGKCVKNYVIQVSSFMIDAFPATHPYIVHYDPLHVINAPDGLGDFHLQFTYPYALHRSS